MARLNGKVILDVSINLIISEKEARALDALVGYGDDAFIKVFYEKLGQAYMLKHEDGLREFLTSVRQLMPNILKQIDDVREISKFK